MEKTSNEKISSGKNTQAKKYLGEKNDSVHITI